MADAATDPKRLARIGPFGAGVQIIWTKHANDQYFSRFHPRGFTQAVIEEHFRSPVTKRQDVEDRRFPGERYLRWSMLEVTRAGKKTVEEVRFVFAIFQPKTDKDPGAVSLITVMWE